MELSYSTASGSTRIQIEPGLSRRAGESLSLVLPAPRKVAVVTDRNVATFHAPPLLQSLRIAGYDARSLQIPPGEASKSLKMLGSLYDRLLAGGLARDSVIVALGGGVVGDLAGFAASTLLRGIALVQVPTTLIAQVDSAIGGKTGINRGPAKNQIGSFWQPAAVWIDPETLRTLPDREFQSGLGEVVKYGMIRAPDIWKKLASVASWRALKESDSLPGLLEQCVAIKVGIAGRDEREAGERALLNFGHTVGHALESAEGFQGLLHGEAVAVGMVAATHLAVELSMASSELESELRTLLQHCGLPSSTPRTPEEIRVHLPHDKKRHQGRGRWVLPRALGVVELVSDPPEEAVYKALQAIQAAPPPSPEPSSPPAPT